MTPLKLIFVGSGEFGLPTLRALIDAKHQVLQVISQPDRPAGRGRKLTPTPVAQLALEMNLPLLRTANINAETIAPADAMVVIAFGQKIGDHIVKAPRLGAVNLHASRLPRYRGAAPINWQIINGDSLAGNTIIRLAMKMDAGAMLAQSELLIDPMETAGELHDRLSADGAPLVLNVLQLLSAGQATEIPQDESLATTAPKLNRAAAVIDWMRSADEIARRIRGLSPWPGCHARLIDAAGTQVSRLTLVRARPASGEGNRWKSGEITTAGFISAADGAQSVEVLEIQPEGGRPMPLADYRRGHPWLPGMRVESIQ